ncbi:MAG TPA: hypothetical protein DEA96_00955 [Leptospiraceae bacterium]|nr:hypothetical protein [Leptospiraceae bacterium]
MTTGNSRPSRAKEEGDSGPLDSTDNASESSESSDSEASETSSASSPSGKFWQNLGKGIVDAALATGQTLKYVYEKGDENKHFIVPAINGLVGHRLAEFNDPAAISMSFRLNGADAKPAEVWQSEKERLDGRAGTCVLFVHGLMADEIPWQAAMAGKTGYGPELSRQCNAGVLYLRYNTGKHISENGQELDRLVDQLMQVSSGEIKRLILVGHSMGGLVVRSAGYYGARRKSKWVSVLSDVVLIGAPNDGSFLERFGHVATFVLKTIWNYPTRIIGRIADERSNGIKDLRWGFMTEDWKHEDANKLMNVKKTEVPPLPGVHYHLLLGSVSETVLTPVAMYFGDGLVGTRSALGKEFVEFNQKATKTASNFSWLRKNRTPTIEYHAFMTTGHLGLLGSPEISDYLIKTIES